MASELQLHELTDILRRRKRLILAMAAAGTVLTGAGALLIPPRYTATAPRRTRPDRQPERRGLHHCDAGDQPGVGWPHRTGPRQPAR